VSTRPLIIDGRGIIERWPLAPTDPVEPDGWLVLRCRPRHEKVVVNALRAGGHGGILLLHERKHLSPVRGPRITTVPLLSGYVFARSASGSGDDVLPAVRPYVVTFLRPPPDARFASELDNVLRLIRGSPERVWLKPQIAIGTEVEITDGSLAGCRGFVVRRDRESEVVVNLSLLGCSVATSVPVHLIEPVAEPPT
jgi:transcription antitermination factor NusG